MRELNRNGVIMDKLEYLDERFMQRFFVGNEAPIESQRPRVAEASMQVRCSDGALRSRFWAMLTARRISGVYRRHWMMQTGEKTAR